MSELETKIYISLSTRSRRALVKTSYRPGRLAGRKKSYFPRYALISRLMAQFKLSETEVINTLFAIRKYLLNQIDQAS